MGSKQVSKLIVSSMLVAVIAGCQSPGKTEAPGKTHVSQLAEPANGSARAPSSSEDDVPKVPQYVYVAYPNSIDPITGKPQGIPNSKVELIREARQIKDVHYSTSDASTIWVRLSSAYITNSVAVVFKFSSKDAAKVFRNTLVEGDRSYVFVVDTRENYWADASAYEITYSVAAAVTYVWDDKENKVMKLGELIGPQRSVEEQSYWGQFMVKLFGKSYLNKVNFSTQPKAGPKPRDI